MNTQNDKSIVIVGAGHAGGSLAAFLRQYGYQGKITLIGDEALPPYHRPPLSKAWLKGEVALDALQLKSEAFYKTQNIELVLGSQVLSLDPVAKVVHLASGQNCRYDELVLATGADSRRLSIPGAGLGNVFHLRNLSDAERLSAAFKVVKKLAVVGGGYIGLECAATARAMGIEVTIFERSPRILERVASSQLSDFLTQYHTAQGVKFSLEASVIEFIGADSVTGIRLADGKTYECDAVLVGVGAVPSTVLAEAAGLDCPDGIPVDEDCQTALTSIFAIGDVAKRPHFLLQRELRIESVPSAMEQAKRVAALLTGKAPSAEEQPWFWSDQYDLKLQMVGLLGNANQCVVRGDVGAGKFCIFHFVDDLLVAAEAINAPPDFFAAKKMVGKQLAIDKRFLADLSVPLNNFIK
jgi:3-phenylpropionate/trans-cinnamate dioxygenase ferredoxin reductase subunit